MHLNLRDERQPSGKGITVEDLSDVKIVKTPYGTLRLEPITKEAKDWAIKAIQEKGNEEVQTT